MAYGPHNPDSYQDTLLAVSLRNLPPSMKSEIFSTRPYPSVKFPMHDFRVLRSPSIPFTSSPAWYHSFSCTNGTISSCVPLVAAVAVDNLLLAFPRADLRLELGWRFSGPGCSPLFASRRANYSYACACVLGA